MLGRTAPLVALCLAPSALGQSIERISVASGGAQADAASSAVTRASDDGRFVVFASTASNLFAGDAPGTRDLFVRDRASGTTTRIAGDVAPADLTGDGRSVAYVDTTGPRPQAFVHDLVLALTTALEPGGTSERPRFSGDGTFVVYTRGDATATAPVVLVRRALAGGAVDLVSGTPSGAENIVPAHVGAVSFDGSLVTFTTADPGLVGSDGNGVADALVRDFGFGFTDRFSVADGGAELALPSLAGPFSGDTRFLLFSTADGNVVGDDANGAEDLFALDRFLGGVIALSTAPLGTTGNGASTAEGAWASADGTRVVFASDASDLVAGDGNGARDVFELDMATGVTRRLVLGLGGAEPDAAVELAAVSPDGRFVTVVSAAANLVAGDTNGVADAFLVDLGPQCSVSEVCSAQPNSTGSPASIGATGDPSFALNNFVLSASGLPADAACLFFHGTARLDPPAPFGDGLLCAGGTLRRLGMLQAVGDNVIQFQDLASSAYAGIAPGDARVFQLWYRDQGAGPASFNATAGLEVLFCP